MIAGDHRAYLTRLFTIGITACLPVQAMAGQLPASPPSGRTLILGAGKAAAQMAAIAEAELIGPVAGCVVTRYGFADDVTLGALSMVEVLEAGHPIPDQQSVIGAARLLSLAAEATEDDRVIFLLSGGGSALLCAPIEGVSLAQKQAITAHLVASGTPIEDINLVRRHLSRIKGGGLSAAAGTAEQLSLILSDVVGDDPQAIASGPTVPGERDLDRFCTILDAAGYANIEPLKVTVKASMDHTLAEISVKDHDVRIIGSGDVALAAIEKTLAGDGWPVLNLGACIEGEARAIGAQHAACMREQWGKGERLAIISGGELTVTLANQRGRGGPNLEYLAGLATGLPRGRMFCAFAGDSDGIDGSEDHAGAYLDGAVIDRMHALGLSAGEALANNDTYPFFETLGTLVRTGPTGTNVNDIRMILVN